MRSLVSHQLPVHSGYRSLFTAVLLACAVCALSGCKEAQVAGRDPANGYGENSSRMLASGTRIRVTLGGNLSSETANVGDVWHGTVSENVSGSNGGVIPPGSEVDGVVVGVTRAKRGSRAMLELGIRSIRVNGAELNVGASAAPVIAGSTRKRNVGAVAGGALAGVLIGKSVGDGKNGAVGGLIGGAATAGVVAGSKGFQVLLSDGSTMSFTVSRTVAMR